MSELLPCPFCGRSDAEIEYVNQDISFYVECKVCLACGPIIHSIKNNDKDSSKIEASELWNTRIVREQGKVYLNPVWKNYGQIHEGDE